MNTNNENQNNQQINTNTETIELTFKELEVLVDLAQMGASGAWNILEEKINAGEDYELDDEMNELCHDYCFIRNKAYFALNSLKKKRAEAKKKVTTIAVQ